MEGLVGSGANIHVRVLLHERAPASCPEEDIQQTKGVLFHQHGGKKHVYIMSLYMHVVSLSVFYIKILPVFVEAGVSQPVVVLGAHEHQKAVHGILVVVISGNVVPNRER